MVRIENKLLTFKESLKAEQEKLSKIEAAEIVEDENNPFSVEERIEAKNDAIESIKEDITELEEIIEEIIEEMTDEQIESYNKGVKNIKSPAELEDFLIFEAITVNFKIVSNKNENVSTEGYVTINDEEAADVDWYYWTGNGYQSEPFYHHDQEEIAGLTAEQNAEIDEFKNDYMDDALWIDTVILQSDEDENRTYIRKNCTIIINEGAKMECEIIEDVDNDNEYIVEVIPKFNGETANLVEYMSAMGEVFDPYDENGYCEIENGHIFFEISKNYFDESLKEDELDIINEEACKIYARSLTYNMGIYAKYGDMMEQALDDSYDNEWLFKMSQHENDTHEEIDAFLREEGLIDEELEY